MQRSGWLLMSAALPLPAIAASNNDTNTMLVALAVLLLLVIVISIYNRKLQLKQKVAETEFNTLKNLLEQSYEFIAVLNSKLELTYINPAFSSVIPYQESLSSLFKDEKSDVLLLPEIAKQAYWEGEAWLKLTNDEKRMPITLTLSYHLDSDRYLFAARDNSIKKQQLSGQDSDYIYDSETGLYTPLVLNQFIQTAINSTTSNQPQFAVFLIKYNQVLSYVAATPQGKLHDVIRSLSVQLKQYSAQGAVVARYNTDTLAILIPSHLCSNHIEVNLNRLAQNILQTAKQAAQQFEQSALKSYVGISIYPLDGATPTILLNSAATAICNAARLGRSNMQFANSRYQLKAPEYQTLEAELLKAQANDEFEVYYQPRLSIGSNRVIGYEALLRWHNPKRGILAPQYFLNVADDTGQVIALDKLVFRKCCQQLKHWQQSGISRGRISINISDQSFQQPDFVSTLQQQLEESQLTAELFELELHEDIFLQADSTLIATLQQLITLGFHLTLDNFGQGVSSLSVLRDYPLHSLKIAQSFIRDMEHNEQQRNITASLIRLASYFQLDVIATGIENEMQAYLLHVMGCDILQGHLFSKALPASEVPALLARENRLLRKEVS